MADEKSQQPEAVSSTADQSPPTEKATQGAVVTSVPDAEGDKEKHARPERTATFQDYMVGTRAPFNAMPDAYSAFSFILFIAHLPICHEMGLGGLCCRAHCCHRVGSDLAFDERDFWYINLSCLWLLGYGTALKRGTDTFIGRFVGKFSEFSTGRVDGFEKDINQLS
jgi:hypothetical protein